MFVQIRPTFSQQQKRTQQMKEQFLTNLKQASVVYMDETYITDFTLAENGLFFLRYKKDNLPHECHFFVNEPDFEVTFNDGVYTLSQYGYPMEMKLFAQIRPTSL
jgi:hypothetical protein